MKITRNELYDLVWAEPMTAVSKRFGLSDVGLRKHCVSMNIPTPPVGYWAKLQHGHQTEILPLPEDYTGKKQFVDLSEEDPSEMAEFELNPPVNRLKEREIEISSGNTSCFIVPEVLYAKDPVIIDTKERLRQESNRDYLSRNPFTSKIKSTLNVYVSEKSVDRALTIFSTVINALRFRGHNIKIDDHKTYAIIKDETILIDISEKKKKNPDSVNSPLSEPYIFSGELHFNIYYGYNERDIFKDTAHTKLEDKIISIVANLEIRSEKIKEERIEAENRRIIREEEERKARIYKDKCKAEKKEFKALFKMAERLYKTNILRQYINTYEEFLKGRGELDDESAAKLKWARDKADWLDPFISKEDEYLDSYDKDEITQTEGSNQFSDSYSGSSLSQYPFWLKSNYNRY